MNEVVRILPLILGFFASVNFSHAQARVWTDDADRQVEAELVRRDGDSVILKLADGREAPFPLAKLSAADRQFVAEAAKSSSEDDRFVGKWPDRVKFEGDIAIAVVEENADQNSFIYESLNYRYTSDVRLSRSVVNGFASLFEATFALCRALPIGLDAGRLVDGKLPIRLFEKHESYVSAGGPRESAGVFIPRTGEVMVPLSSLGVRSVGSGYMFDRSKSNKTLPHELTHQLTPSVYFEPGALGWFSEGVAEYVAISPYRSGAYNLRSNIRPIMDYVVGYGGGKGGRAIGTEISLPSLKSYFLLSYPEFLAGSSVNYGSGLLLATYFFHMDGEGDAARIKRFLAALRDGKTGEPALEVLLDGRTYEELQEEITKAWGRRGVTFSFQAAPAA